MTNPNDPPPGYPPAPPPPPGYQPPAYPPPAAPGPTGPPPGAPTPPPYVPPPPGYVPGQPYTPPAPPPQYGYPGAPVAAARAKNPLFVLVIVGAIVLAVGAFLSWVDFEVVVDDRIAELSVSGIGTASGDAELVQAYETGAEDQSKDGVISITLAVPLVILSLLAWIRGRRGLAIATFVVALVAAGFQIFELVDISSDADRESERSGGSLAVNVGIGVYVSLAGAAIAAVGALIGMIKRPRTV